jgi:hypothetical protein
MDANRLNTGEKIAGISGVLLLIIMFLFDWFTIDVGGGVFDVSTGGNAWESFGFIDLILFLAAISGIALALVATSASKPDMPVALSAITAGLGILGVVLVLFRIISPPDFGVGDLVDVGRGIGVFLGLVATAGIAYGGWAAMQAEGSSFGASASGGDAPPPPPPPPSA